MHCLGSVGPLLNACFHCGSPRDVTTCSSVTPDNIWATAGSNSKNTFHQKQQHPPHFTNTHRGTELFSSQIIGRNNNNIADSYASARNRAVRFVPPAAWDRPAQSCRSGHWTMRYTRPTRNNLHPWWCSAAELSTSAAHGSGSSPFDLVPWRQRRGRRIDLAHTAGWEPPPRSRDTRWPGNTTILAFRRPRKRSSTATPTTTSSATNDDFGLRHSSNRNRQRRRRFVRIRVVLSFEFRKRLGAIGIAASDQKRRTLQRRLRNRGSRVRTPNVAHNNQQKQPDQVFVFDPKLFRLSADWLGYFSQRPVGVEELLQNMGEQVEATRRAGNSHSNKSSNSCDSSCVVIEENHDVARKKESLSPQATAAAPALHALGAGDRMDYRTLFGKVSRLFFGENSARQVFKQVPCLTCRQRYK